MNALAFITLVLQTVAACALLYSCFCRLVRTDETTIREIRLAIWFESVAAGLVIGAPILPLVPEIPTDWAPLTTPMWVWLVLLLAATLVQVVTSKFWRDGVPLDFVKD